MNNTKRTDGAQGTHSRGHRSKKDVPAVNAPREQEEGEEQERNVMGVQSACSSTCADTVAEETPTSTNATKITISKPSEPPFDPRISTVLAPSMAMLQDTATTTTGDDESADMMQNLFDPFPTAPTPLDDLRQLVMAASHVGGAISRDNYGKGGSLNDFEQQIARLVGHEAGVFCLDELQCQLMAARIHSDDVGNTRRIGIHPSSYFRLHSLDAAENIWGFDEVLIGDANRSLSAADVLYHISQLDAPLSCIIVEIPQRENGCSTIPWHDLTRICSRCREKGIRLHLDGARLWEAQPHYHRALQEIGCLFDSVSVSFHESLNALGGAMLLGSKRFTQQANIWKRRLGGCVPTVLPYEISARSQLERNYGSFEARYDKMKSLVTTMTHYFVLTGWPMRFDPPEPQACTVHVYLLGKRKYLEEARKAVLREHNILLFRRLKKVPSYKLVGWDTPAQHPNDMLGGDTPTGSEQQDSTNHSFVKNDSAHRMLGDAIQGYWNEPPPQSQVRQYPQSMLRASKAQRPYPGASMYRNDLYENSEYNGGGYGNSRPYSHQGRFLDDSCVPVETKPAAKGILTQEQAPSSLDATGIYEPYQHYTVGNTSGNGAMASSSLALQASFRQFAPGREVEQGDMNPLCEQGRIMTRNQYQVNKEQREQAPVDLQSYRYDVWQPDSPLGNLSSDSSNQIKPSRFEYYFEWTIGASNVGLHENWFIFGWQQYWKYYTELVNKDHEKRDKYFSTHRSAQQFPLEWSVADNEQNVPDDTSSVSASCGRVNRKDSQGAGGGIPPLAPERSPNDNRDSIPRKSSFGNHPQLYPSGMTPDAGQFNFSSSFPLSNSEQNFAPIPDQPVFTMEHAGDRYGARLHSGMDVNERMHMPGSVRSNENVNYEMPDFDLHAGNRDYTTAATEQATMSSAAQVGITTSNNPTAGATADCAYDKGVPTTREKSTTVPKTRRTRARVAKGANATATVSGTETAQSADAGTQQRQRTTRKRAAARQQKNTQNSKGTKRSRRGVGP